MQKPFFAHPAQFGDESLHGGFGVVGGSFLVVVVGSLVVVVGVMVVVVGFNVDVIGSTVTVVSSGVKVVRTRGTPVVPLEQLPQVAGQNIFTSSEQGGE